MQSRCRDIKKYSPWYTAALYPADGAKYPDLRDALEKLQLNDASLQFEPETSIALGFGFRCGFLGLLHLEIIQERLEREYNLDLVTTAPGVIYRVHKTNGDMIELTNPSNLPDPSEIEYMEEPVVRRRDHGDDRVYRRDHGCFARSAVAFTMVWTILRRPVRF